MPIIQPDTTQAIEFTPIPAGTYPGKVVDVEYKTSKNNNPMVVVSFDVTVEGKTRKKKSWIVITGEGSYNFDQLLRATGFEEVATRLKAGEKIPFDTDSLVGQELNLVIEASVYNDQPSDQIKTYLRK